MFEQGANESQWNVVQLHDKARNELLDGLRTVAGCVGATLGPKGRCVLIQHANATPVVTKDGVSVAKAINLRDPARRAGAELIKEAASRTADVAGDGTTTATVLAYAMVKEGVKAMDRSFNPVAVKRGIDKAVDAVVASLKGMAKPVGEGEGLEQIATISANGDAFIGGLIAQAVRRMGKNGIVTVDDAKGSGTGLEFVEGMQVPSGWLNTYFVTHPDKMTAVLEDAYVLLCDGRISSARDLIPVLELLQKTGRSMLFVAEDVEGEALQTLLINKLRGIVKVCAVKAPGWGTARQELLRDLAVLTGANVVSPSTGLQLKDVKLGDLGEAKKVTVDKATSTFVATGKTEEKVQARVKELRGQLEDAALSGDDRTTLLERIGKMTAGAAVIKVGGLTEIEVREKRDRVDDAICATRAALEEGVVPGGGTALIRAQVDLDALLASGAVTDENERQGVKIVRQACEAPLSKIATNAGGSAPVIVDKVRAATDPFYGWNAAEDRYGDLEQMGVIDPAKVARVAIQHAASVAGIFLTLDATILEDLAKEGGAK